MKCFSRQAATPFLPKAFNKQSTPAAPAAAGVWCYVPAGTAPEPL